MRRPIRRTIPFLAAAALVVGALSLPAAQAGQQPVISGFSPACGTVGTSVNITGQHFMGATEVRFGNTVVPPADWTVNSSTRITAKAPAGGQIRVTTPGGTATSRDHFTISGSCAPTISGFSPTSGPVGTSVTINGSNFVNATLIEFGGVDQTAFTWNPTGTQLSTKVPSGAVDGPIKVTTPLGNVTSSQSFDVTGGAPGAAPTITGFNPVCGPVGTSVVITGTNFTGATDVKFKNTSATSFNVNSSTQITAQVPSGAMTGRISVTTPAGTATSSQSFTVAANGSPTITSFNPTSGSVGTSVQITGTNYTGVTAVRFNDVSAQFTVSSSTQITSTVPQSATTGPISVTNANGTCSSRMNFTVTGGPTITSFSPTRGEVGTAVAILGTNLTGATQVRFGGTRATTFTVNQQGTRIDTRVPDGAKTGRITVVTPNGTAVSSSDFTVLSAFHARSISFDLRRHLVARGFVRAPDGFGDCFQRVPVAIQKRRSGGTWRTIERTVTDGTGFYRERIPDRPGTYRAKAPKLVLGSDVCRRALSDTERN